MPPVLVTDGANHKLALAPKKKMSAEQMAAPDKTAAPTGREGDLIVEPDCAVQKSLGTRQGFEDAQSIREELEREFSQQAPAFSASTLQSGRCGR